MPATDAERLVILVEANTKQITNAMTKLQKDVERSMRGSTRAVAQLDGQLRKMQGTIGKAAGLFGVAFGARAFVGMIKSSVEAGQAIGDMAEKLGVSAESLQEFEFVGSQVGTSMDTIEISFRTMAKTLDGLKRGTKEATNQFAEIGFTWADMKNKSPLEVFEMLLDRIGTTADPIERNVRLMKFFGKNGSEMGKMASLGAKGIDELRESARKMGLIISNETIAKMQDTGDSFDKLSFFGRAAGITLTEDFLPVIEKISAIIMSQGFQDALKAFSAVLGGIVGFLAEHPELARIMGAAAAGYAVAGPLGAAGFGLGQGANEVQRSLTTPPMPGLTNPDTGHKVLDLGTIYKKADRSFKTIDPAGQAALEAFKKQIAAIGSRTAALKVETATMRMSNAEQERAKIVSDLMSSAEENHVHVTAALTASINKQADAYAAAAQMAEDAKNFYGALDDLASNVFDAFDQVVNGAESAEDAVKSLLKELLKSEAKSLFLRAFNPSAAPGPLSALLGGLGGGGGSVLAGAGLAGFRAGGGPVEAGKVYGIGEDGPELFVPRVPGTVIPNGRRAGGDIVYAPVIDMRGADSAAVARLAQVMAEDKRSFEQNVVGAVVRARRNRQLS